MVYKATLKYLLAISFSILIHVNYGYAQIDTIKAANITFKLPNSKWKLKDIQQQNRQTIYNYEREGIKDSLGRLVLPIITFSVENVPENFNLVNFTLKKESEYPNKIISVFTAESPSPILKYADAIGWECIYTAENIQHTSYFIHLKNKDKGVQIIMDMTSELFIIYKKEFTDALISIKEL